MESGSAVLGSHSEIHWNYGKIKHEKGLKFGSSFNGPDPAIDPRVWGSAAPPQLLPYAPCAG